MKYIIKAGQKDWNPVEFPWPYFPKPGSHWVYDIEFTDSCWYNWLPDADQYDWNKIGGVTNFLSPNNVDSALVAWRPLAETENLFEIAPYFNIGQSFVPGDPVTVASGTITRATITYYGNKEFGIQVKDANSMSRTLEKFWIGRRIGMNMGGANNAEGLYGGVASQDMEMYVTCWFVK